MKFFLFLLCFLFLKLFKNLLLGFLKLFYIGSEKVKLKVA